MLINTSPTKTVDLTLEDKNPKSTVEMKVELVKLVESDTDGVLTFLRFFNR